MSIASPGLRSRLIDRYLLSQMSGRLALSLGIVLSALLIERVLRLLDLLAAKGGSLQPVLTMVVSLFPHYLGLALPAAFFLSVMTVIMRLSEGSEIDVLQSAGLSMRRLVLPFVVVGLALSVLSLAISGYLQPFARYSYRAALNTVTGGAWIGPVSVGRFIDAGQGIVFFAAGASPDGQVLQGIFIEHARRDGGTDVITAKNGSLLDDPADPGRRVLVLNDGQQVRVKPTGATVLHFDRLTIPRELLRSTAFRPRGRDARELTLDELWSAIRRGDGPVGAAAMESELHGRLVRAAAMALLPLLAVPMGVTAKRQRRGAGLVVAALVLVLFHHMLQFGQGLVEAGHLSALPAIWSPFAVFAAFTGWVLLQSDRRPGQGIFESLLAGIEAGMSGMRGWFSRAGNRR
jgi:lipopolysaccharide export system permease protein